MSLFDYRQSREISARAYSFDALIMAALRRADTENLYRLRGVFPEIASEMQERYDAPGGLLPGETAPEDFTVNLEDE